MTEPGALLGSTVNERYRLIEIAGRGGMAFVYKAEDTRHRRTVAIKVFRADLTRDGILDRFTKEIAILATLQHPNILPLLDSGTIDDSPYYVMPFVQGESLRERIARGGRLPVADAIRILVEMADALRYAHEHGVIHRDLKPENILLSGRHALLADFGIARTLITGDPRHTTAGYALGTPAYMAPEQASADPDLDGRVDIFALGIVAHEMIAGAHPFAKDTPAAALAAQLTETAPPLDELRLDVPRDVAAVVTRCLAKRREDRWQSVELLHDALEPLMMHSGAATPVATPASHQRRWWPVLAAAVVAIGATGWFLTNRAAPTLSVTATRRLSAASDLELDPALSPDGRFLAYVAGTNGALRLFVRQLAGGGDPVEIAKDVGGNQRIPRWLSDGTGLVFQANGSIYRVPTLGGPAQFVVEGSPEQPAENPAPSPDGRQIGYTQNAEIRIRALAGGNPTVLVRDGQAHSLDFDPTGRRLAYVSGNRDFALGEGLFGNVAPSRVRIVGTDGSAPIDVTNGTSLAVGPLWWNERTLIFVSNAGGVRDLYAQPLTGAGTPRGSPQRLTTGFNAHAARRTPDGTGLAVAVLEHASNLWRLPLVSSGVATMAEAEPVTTGSQVVEDVDVLPGSGWVAFDSNREGTQDLFLLSPGSSRPIQISRDSTDEFGPAWSPNGKEIAYYAVRDGIRHLFVMRATGADVRQLTADSLQDQQPHWSPDGRKLVFYRRDGALRDRLFIIERRPDSTWSDPRPLSDEYGTAATWSADGRWIAFADPEGRIRLVGAEGGESRVIAAPTQVGGRPLKRPQWMPFDPALLARTDEPGGRGSLWRVNIVDGSVTEVARFDDPRLPTFRDDFATDGDYVYFTVSVFEGSLWILDVATP